MQLPDWSLVSLWYIVLTDDWSRMAQLTVGRAGGARFFKKANEAALASKFLPWHLWTMYYKLEAEPIFFPHLTTPTPAPPSWFWSWCFITVIEILRYMVTMSSWFKCLKRYTWALDIWLMLSLGPPSSLLHCPPHHSHISDQLFLAIITHLYQRWTSGSMFPFNYSPAPKHNFSIMSPSLRLLPLKSREIQTKQTRSHMAFLKGRNGLNPCVVWTPRSSSLDIGPPVYVYTFSSSKFHSHW